MCHVVRKSVKVENRCLKEQHQLNCPDRAEGRDESLYHISTFNQLQALMLREQLGHLVFNASNGHQFPAAAAAAAAAAARTRAASPMHTTTH